MDKKDSLNSGGAARLGGEVRSSAIPELPVTKLIHGSAFIPRLSDLEKAYALAYKFSQTGPSNEERARHRAVAHLIWKSCGGAASTRTTPPNLADKPNSNADEVYQRGLDIIRKEDA